MLLPQMDDGYKKPGRIARIQFLDLISGEIYAADL